MNIYRTWDKMAGGETEKVTEKLAREHIRSLGYDETFAFELMCQGYKVRTSFSVYWIVSLGDIERSTT